MEVSRLNPYIRYMDMRTCSVSYKAPVLAYDYRLFAICEGQCALHIDGKTLSLNKDDLIVFPPALPYRFVFCEQAPAVLYDINFDLEFRHAGSASLPPAEIERFAPEKLPEPPDETLFAHPLHLPAAPDLRRLTGEILVERENGGAYCDEACACLLARLLILALRRSDTPPADPLPALIASVSRYLDEHCREKLPAQQLGREFGYHPFYLNRLFRAQTGETLHQHQLECRLKRACTMLECTSLTIREIAESLGFSSPAYFSELFRQKRGVTPGQYRAQRRSL